MYLGEESCGNCWIVVILCQSVSETARLLLNYCFLFPPAVYEGCNFFTSSPTLVSRLFDSRHPSGCDGFKFAFPWWSMVSLFMCSWLFVFLLWGNVYLDHLPIFNWVFTLDVTKSHNWMWEFDYKESWALKNWCLWTVALEKTLESPLDCKEIQPVHCKGDQSWVFIGRNDVEAETPILWPPDVKSWLTGKDPDTRKDWKQEEKGTTEEEMAGWHHWLDGHEFEKALGVDEGQGSLACCSPWCLKGLDMTEWLNWTLSF